MKNGTINSSLPVGDLDSHGLLEFLYGTAVIMRPGIFNVLYVVEPHGSLPFFSSSFLSSLSYRQR